MVDVYPWGTPPQPIQPPIQPPPFGSYNMPAMGYPNPPHPPKLKCPLTHIIRVYSNQADEGTISVDPKSCDKKHRYWVDLEAVQEIQVFGTQWRGPGRGNLGQKTWQLLREGKIGNYGKDLVNISVKLGPETEDQAGKCEWGGDDDDVIIHAKDCSKWVTRQWAVERHFKNHAPERCGEKEDPNKCRKKTAQKWKVQFNNIDDEMLMGSASGQPPDIPQEYKNAIRLSADNSPLYLHVEIATEVTHFRGKGTESQVVGYQLWNGRAPSSGKPIDLPGAKPTPKDEKTIAHVRLDPYQMAINFGPDGLAVELKGSGNAAGDAGGGDGGALGGAFGGIMANMLGGAVPAG